MARRKIEKMRFAAIIALTLYCFSNLSAQHEWRDKGDTEVELKNFKAAIQSYTEHLNINVTDAQTMIKLAECYDYIHDWENAAKYYFEALAYSVSSEYLMKNGLIQMKLGHYEIAKKQFENYVSIDPLLAENYINNCDYAMQHNNMTPLYQVHPLAINSKQADFSPSFFKNKLVYVSDRKDLLRTDALDATTFANNPKHNFVLQSNADGTQTPQYLRSWFHDNNLINEGPISFSADGQWVAFVQNNYVAGLSKVAFDLFKGAIFIAKINSNGDWENAQDFPFNGLYTNNYPFLTKDGRKLYFSSNKKGGFGGYDIYVSEKINGVWTEPRNMGKYINSSGNETAPFIDGTDFYFSSDYKTGFGGLDVFKANFDNGEWTIKNLGIGVNSSANDYGFIYNKKRNKGFFCSDRSRVENIYSVRKIADDIDIIVLDATTRTPITKAILDFSECKEGQYITDSKGLLSFNLSAQLNCRLHVNKTGYQKRTITVNQEWSAKKIIEIFLYKEDQIYQGKIVDGVHDTNLSNVRVRVINQSNGHKYDVYSDDDGIYTLGLKPNVNYLVQFNKMGYVAIIDKVFTGDGSDKGILGSQLLFSTNNNQDRKPNTVVHDTTTILQPTTVSVPNIPSPVNTKETKPITNHQTPNLTTALPKLVPGFSVQLLSLSLSNQNFPEEIQKLKGLVSRIYTITDHQWTRYRVGTYRTKEEVQSVLADIKAIGFKSAYIVVENTNGLIKNVDL